MTHFNGTMLRPPQTTPNTASPLKLRETCLRTRSPLSKWTTGRTMAKNAGQFSAWRKTVFCWWPTRSETTAFASSPPVERNPTKNENIMSKTPATTKHDWSRLDAMSDQERHAAALSDPDAQPLTPEDFKRMKRTPQVRIIRRALGLSQEEFARRFHIPLGTLRDWEQGRKDPDTAARAYLRVIGHNPAAVTEALRLRP